MAQVKETFLPPLWVITLLVVAVLLWLVIALQELVVLLILSYSVSYILDPVLIALERRKISRPVGIFVVLGALAIVFIVLFLTALPVLSREYERLLDNFPGYFDQAKERLFTSLEKLTVYLPQGGTHREEFFNRAKEGLSASGDLLSSLVSGLLNTIFGGYSLALSIVNLILLPVIVFYLSMGFDSFHLSLANAIPANLRKTIIPIAKEIDGYVSSFVRGQFMVSGITSILYCTALAITGIDLPIIVGLLAGFGNIVPYLGFVLGLSLSTIMALTTFGDLGHLLIVWGAFFGVYILDGFIITPKVVGTKVGLSPLAIILALLAGGKLFGLIGVFLAIPGAAALKVLLRHAGIWVESR